jgi:4-amino-4-deoxy-L-arabinose transferase-like glycosyltransferase
MQYMPLTKWLTTNHLNLLSMCYFPKNFVYEYDPLFLYLILAIFFTIFGESLWIPHLIIIFFGFLTLYFTYLLGSYLYNKKIGFMASLILFFFPLFFAQTTLYQWSIPFTAFMMMTLYFFIKRNKIGYILSSIFMVMVTEMSIIVIFIILIYFLCQNLKKNKFELIKNFLFYSIPLFIFGVWMLWNKLVFGSFLSSDQFSMFIGPSFESFIDRFLSIFIYNNIWILTSINIIFLLTLVMKRKNKKFKIRGEVLLLLFIILVYFSIFSFMRKDVGFLIRYSLHIYPIFFIFTINSLSNLLKNKYVLILVVSALIILFISDWQGVRPFYQGYSETNLRYLDIVKADQKMANYIETNFSDSFVLAAWPQCWELAEPSYGYVNKSIKSRHFSAINKDISNIDLIFYSPYSSSQNEILEIIGSLNLTLIKEFGVNEEYIRLYEINK